MVTDEQYFEAPSVPHDFLSQGISYAPPPVFQRRGSGKGLWTVCDVVSPGIDMEDIYYLLSFTACMERVGEPM